MGWRPGSVFAALVLAVAAAAGAGGCGGNQASAYVDGLAPLDPVLQAPWPAPVDGDTYPERVSWAQGDGNGYVWVHGAAYVHAPLDQVWRAMRDPAASADRRSVTSWTVTLDDEPSYAYSYVLHNTVDAVVTVQFDNSWRHDATEGTRDQPLAVRAAYQKTWGTTFIGLLAGSFLARQLDDGATTSLEMMEHLAAFSKDASTAQQTLDDYYRSVVAGAKMLPLPTY